MFPGFAGRLCREDARSDGHFLPTSAPREDKPPGNFFLRHCPDAIIASRRAQNGRRTPAMNLLFTLMPA
jgi:hypothetical protein